MRIVFLQVCVLLALSAIAAVLTWKFHPNAPALSLNAEPLGDGEVSIEQALAWQDAGGVIWIDARPEEKHARAHIPEALLLNESDFNRLLMESFHLIANQDRPIVVYCGSYSCKTSKKIADELRAKMIPDVYVLKGGWEAWAKATGNFVPKR